MHVAISSAQGDFVLEVRVLRYQNPSGRGISLPVDTCCDSGCPSTDPCDNSFTFCLRPLKTLGLDSCPFGMFQTPLTGGDNEVFITGTTALLGLPNPLAFTAGPAWPVRLLNRSSIGSCYGIYTDEKLLSPFRALCSFW